MGEEVIRVTEWEAGLPTDDDLPPLSQSLIPPVLAKVFKISPEPPHTLLDACLPGHPLLPSCSFYSCTTTTNATRSGCFDFKHFIDDRNGNHRENPLAVWDHEMAEAKHDELGTKKGSNPKKPHRMESAEAASCAGTSAIEHCMDDRSVDAKAMKMARLVWTPQLHKRFVEVVAHLGLKNAVPKSIMQLMNVEGLTREKVASHLQKYRLYVKRMQGLSNEAPSASDKLIPSMTVPPHSFNELSSGVANGSGPSGHKNGNSSGGGDKENHVGMPIPMLYPPPSLQILPMPTMGMGYTANRREQMRMPVGSINSPSGFPAYENHSHHHHYQQKCNSKLV